MPMRPASVPFVALFVCSALVVDHADADVVTLDAIADATLYESSPDAPLANGAGASFFTGTNNGGLARRGLLRFDVAAAFAGLDVRIDAVELVLHAVQGNPSPSNAVQLHRVARAWAEGPDVAPGNGGGGTAASDGSATWFDSIRGAFAWETPGGDFATDASATTIVDALGETRWSGDGLREDVASWIAADAMSFGWLLLGDESAAGTAIRFASRENGDPALAPSLRVEFTVIPAPGALAVLAMSGLAGRRRRG